MRPFLWYSPRQAIQLMRQSLAHLRSRASSAGGMVKQQRCFIKFGLMHSYLNGCCVFNAEVPLEIHNKHGVWKPKSLHVIADRQMWLSADSPESDITSICSYTFKALNWNQTIYNYNNCWQDLEDTCSNSLAEKLSISFFHAIQLQR